MDDWQPYLKDRLIRRDPKGFVVIVPSETTDPVPLSCPVCSFVFRSHDDEVAYNEYSCCDRCARLWAHARRQQWKDGWRPSPEQVKNEEQTRVPLSIVLSID